MNLFKILIPTGKLRAWLVIFLNGILFFSFCRALFLLAHMPLIRDSRASDIAYSFWLGLRFDIVILSWIILPLFVISLLPFIKLSSQFGQKMFSIVLTVIFSMAFMISLADIRYFDNFGSRMNYWAVDYIVYPSLFLYSAISYPGFWMLLALWIFVTVMFYLAVRKIFRKAGATPPSGRLTKRIICCVMAAALLVLGIRGSVGMKPLDWGAAFFSDDPFLNQTALNGIYTLTRSIYEELQEGRKLFGQESDRFSFYPVEDTYGTVLDMLNIKPEMPENFSLEHKTPGKDRFPFKPNIIIIIMESWSADKIGALGSRFGVTPDFDTLCNHGILFTNFYANGVRTNRGIPAVLCSFPSLPGRSIMKRYAAGYPFRSIGDILREKGYSTTFAYGGDIEFDNMEGFLRTAGYERFYGESDFDRSARLGKWGIPDHVIFDKLAHEVSNFPRPFHLAVLTLSNHDPYLIPDDRFKKYGEAVPDGNMLNTFYYTDWALGQFIDSLKSEPLFDSTIFVITADHCPHQGGKYPLAPRNFHIPLLIYGPKLLGDSAAIIGKISSQVDILPTLIDLLGIETRQYSWGRDLLNLPPDDSGFAVITAEDRLGLIEKRFFFFNWLGAGKILYDMNTPDYLQFNVINSHPDTAARMEIRLGSYIELANYLSRGGRKK